MCFMFRLLRRIQMLRDGSNKIGGQKVDFFTRSNCVKEVFVSFESVPFWFHQFAPLLQTSTAKEEYPSFCRKGLFVYKGEIEIRQVMMLLSLIFVSIFLFMAVYFSISNTPIIKDVQGFDAGIFVGALGGVLGGSFTYFAVKKTLENDRLRAIEDNRSYLSITNRITTYTAIMKQGSTRILSTDEIRKLHKIYPVNQNNEVFYFEINHSGNPSVIYDVNLKITYPNNKVANNYLGIIEKSTKILVPLYPIYLPESKKENPSFAEITYRTLGGERIIYRIKYDHIKNTTKEQYLTIENNKEKLIIDSPEHTAVSYINLLEGK
ncbi:hypothetical protein [Paenibacillus gorillae]|uniref:hypothetical protein n=1 Tax=Paenibacillus gorillae TaxID=1243662 RepID=UPI0004B7EE75|nr:hypothetical protein [Paenibacillus gorillae]